MYEKCREYCIVPTTSLTRVVHTSTLHIHSRMLLTHSVLLILLWSLVEVHSQTAPYLTFMNHTIPNHAYVNLSLIGEVGGTVHEDSGNEVFTWIRIVGVILAMENGSSPMELNCQGRTIIQSLLSLEEDWTRE